MGNKLDFILKISENNEDKIRLANPVIEFMNSSKKLRVIEKIPKNIGEQLTSDKMTTRIDVINMRQTNLTRKIDEIRSEMRCQVPQRYSKSFDDLFNVWNTSKTVTKEFAKEIESQVKFINTIFSELKEKFSNELIAADERKKNSVTLMNLATTTCDKLLKTKDAAKSIVEQLNYFMLNISQSQLDWYKALENIKATVMKYNKQRTLLAKYLIGNINSLKLAQ